MTYAVTNPPAMASERIGGGPAIWIYSSADPIATVDNTDYFTNAGELGMRTGDIIFITDTVNNLVSAGKIVVDSGGNGTASAFTAFP